MNQKKHSTNDPLLAALETFTESEGTEADSERFHAAIEAVKSRNQELKTPILNCTLTFECPKTWAGLDHTEKDNVRFCQQCKRNVTMCMSQGELDTLTAAGECVAFSGRELRTMVGSKRAPDKPSLGAKEREKLRSFLTNYDPIKPNQASSGHSSAVLQANDHDKDQSVTRTHTAD